MDEKDREIQSNLHLNTPKKKQKQAPVSPESYISGSQPSEHASYTKPETMNHTKTASYLSALNIVATPPPLNTSSPDPDKFNQKYNAINEHTRSISLLSCKSSNKQQQRPIFNMANSNPPQIRVARSTVTMPIQQRHIRRVSKHSNLSRTSLPDLQTITQQPIPAMNSHQASHSIVVTNPHHRYNQSQQRMKMKTASNYKLLHQQAPIVPQSQRYIMMNPTAAGNSGHKQQRISQHLNVGSSLNAIGIASIPATPPGIKEITPSPSPQPPQPQTTAVPKQFIYESPQRSVNSINGPFEVADNGQIVISSPIPNEQIANIEHVSSSSDSENVGDAQETSPIMNEATDIKVIGRRELKKEIKRKSLQMQQQFCFVCFSQLRNV